MCLASGNAGVTAFPEIFRTRDLSVLLLRDSLSDCYCFVLIFYSSVIQCFAAIVNHLILFEFYIC